MATKVITHGTSACTRHSVQCTAVKRIRLDADNGTDDVTAMFDDWDVLAD